MVFLEKLATTLGVGSFALLIFACGEGDSLGGPSICVKRLELTIRINGEYPPPDDFVTCPRALTLAEELLDPALLSIRFNGEELPEYSCEQGPSAEPLVACEGPEDARCGEVSCMRSWIYDLDGDPLSPGGRIHFAAHVDPCYWPDEEGVLRLELDYATPCQ